MREKISIQLWVAKFCLKVIYPKYNYYLFLVFLAIKCRIYYNKRTSKMNSYSVRMVPTSTMRLLMKGYIIEQLPIVFHKCLVISREQYVQLCAENLFYEDNGMLWLAMKLAQNTKKKHKNKTNTSNQWKFNLGLVTSQIHKKLWTDEHFCSTDNIRIVPVVGSKEVENNVCFMAENEFQNIISCYNMKDFQDIEVSFHPMPSLDNSPKIAATAEASLIVNDYDLSNDFVKEVLSNHFELPKLMSINDVFSIELTPEITAQYHYKYLDLVESAGRLYFRCRKIASDSETTNNCSSCNNIIQPYYIIKGVTQLTLGENIHMLKPKDEYFKTAGTKQMSLQYLQLCPLGLKQKFDQIQETISPFLTGELNDLSSSMTSPLIPMLLLTGSIGSGRHLLAKTLAKYNGKVFVTFDNVRVGMNCLQIDCNALQSSTAKQTESKINSTIQKAKASAPVMVVLDNFEVFAVDPENNEDCRVMEYFMNTITDLYQNYTKHPIVFIAITERVDLKPNILRMFLEKYHIPKLNSEQRYQMLEWFTSVMGLKIEEDGDTSSEIKNEDAGSVGIKTKEVIQRVAAKTETFIYGDLDTLLHFAMRESYLKQLSLPADPDMRMLKEEDFNSALESIRRLQSQHLDAPKIPKVFWEDIGGLDKLKKELLKTIEFPIKYPHLFKNSSLKRSGILLYGPPGCGKTLVAKAVSTELNVSFLSVKGPELLNMYIGQSEENVRKVFESARASSPCIVFLDELDALAPRRGAAGDSGGASDRVVSQLLAEVDGVASGEDADTSSMVFIMGATNRPDLLEQSLLRPGRLDKLIYVGPYCGTREKTSVLTALCRSHKLREEVDLTTVAEALPERCTGADLLHVVTAARAAAVRSLLHRLYQGLVKESQLSVDSVVLGVSDLWQGVETFRPSVTDEELAYYESLQHQM